MKAPSASDTVVKVRAYLTDETFGYDHWRAAQFSAPESEVERYAVLVLFETSEAREVFVQFAQKIMEEQSHAKSHDSPDSKS